MKRYVFIAVSLLVCAGLQTLLIQDNNTILGVASLPGLAFLVSRTMTFVMFFLQVVTYLILVIIYKKVFFLLTFEAEKDSRLFISVVASSFWIFSGLIAVLLIYYKNNPQSYSLFAFGSQLDGRRAPITLVMIVITVLQAIYVSLVYHMKKKSYENFISDTIKLICIMECVQLPGLIKYFRS